MNTRDTATGRQRTNRRRFLAGVGLLGLTGASGCLTSVVGATTDLRASPAASYTGDGTVSERARDDTDAGTSGWIHRSSPPTVTHVPVTVAGEVAGVGGTVELEGWVTTSTLQVQDYNSTRSNKPRSRASDTDADGDGLGDGREEDAAPAQNHNSSRSNRTQPLWAPDEVDGDDLDALYEYLEGDPLVGERFVLALPDARVPGGGGALVGDIAPRRVVAYLTGDTATEATDSAGRRFAWRRGPGLSATLTDESGADRYDPAAQMRALGYGENGNANNATIIGVPELFTGVSGGSGGDGGSTRPGWYTLSDRDGFARGSLDGWGEATVVDGVGVTPPVVGPVLATPPGAPCPMPATLYLGRVRHEGEYLYAGGWTIDEGALWRDSCTVLVSEAPNEVVGVPPSDRSVTHERIGRGLSRERSRHGSLVFDGVLDESALAFLPPGLRRGEGLDRLVELAVADVSGRKPAGEPVVVARDGPPADDEMAVRCLVVPMDCPLVHLVDADSLSTAAKRETNLVPAVNTISSR